MNFFDYFQIASVALMVLFVLGKAVYLRWFRGVNAIVIGRGKKGFTRIVEVLALGALIGWMTIVLLHAFHISSNLLAELLDVSLIDSLPAKILGVIMTSLGLLLFVLAFFAFGDSWRVGIDRQSPGTLVTTGVFAVSRNPIYVFFDLWFVGVSLINGRLFFLIFAMLGVVVMHWQIVREEKFLLQQYGEPYRAYCSRTPRYLIW
jgi:protein-S-isoprenylcysteine O-methyltransferase Ste14